MEAIDAIKTRRSIREYSEKEISEKDVENLLQAAMCAPSAGNEQPWHFIVIRDREILGGIPDIHPYSLMVKKAPLAIVVCGDVSLERYPGFWVQDCSAATENILLAANALGLGAVWLGLYPEEDRVRGMKDLLGLPKNIIPLCVIPLGYPLHRLPGPDRFKEERIHQDRW